MNRVVFREKYLSFADCPLSKFIPQLVTKDGIGWLFFSALGRLDLTLAAQGGLWCPALSLCIG